MKALLFKAFWVLICVLALWAWHNSADAKTYNILASSYYNYVVWGDTLTDETVHHAHVTLPSGVYHLTLFAGLDSVDIGEDSTDDGGDNQFIMWGVPFPDWKIRVPNYGAVTGSDTITSYTTIGLDTLPHGSKVIPIAFRPVAGGSEDDTLTYADSADVMTWYWSQISTSKLFSDSTLEEFPGGFPPASCYDFSYQLADTQVTYVVLILYYEKK